MTYPSRARFRVIQALQQRLRESRDTDDEAAYESAILYALSPNRPDDSEPFLRYDTVRDARHQRVRQRRQGDAANEIGAALVSSRRGRPGKQTPVGHARRRFACWGGAEPHDNLVAKELAEGVRARVQLLGDDAGACLDSMIAGLTAREAAARLQMPLRKVQRLRQRIRTVVAPLAREAA